MSVIDSPKRNKKVKKLTAKIFKNRFTSKDELSKFKDTYLDDNNSLRADVVLESGIVEKLENENKKTLRKIISLIRNNREVIGDYQLYQDQLLNLWHELNSNHLIRNPFTKPWAKLKVLASGDSGCGSPCIFFQTPGLLPAIDDYTSNWLQEFLYHLTSQGPVTEMEFKLAKENNVLSLDEFYPEGALEWADYCEQKYFPKFDYYDEDFRKLRLQVFLRDGEICATCGAKPEPGLSLTIDHIKPVSKFPELARDISNLQVLCWDCNQSKSDKV